MTVTKLFIILGVLAIIISILRNLVWKKGDGLILNIVQNFVGSLFIFSGIVKGIDPTGTGYKMKDYFSSFALDGMPKFWEAMSNFNIPFALGMIIFEIFLGIAILIGWKSRWTTIGLLGINLFFLFLTGYSYLSGFCLSTTIILVSAGLLALLFASSFITHHTKRFRGLTIASVLILLYFVYTKMSGTGIGCEFTATKMKVTDCGCFGDFMKLKPWETFYKDIFLTALSVFLVRYHHRLQSVFSSMKLSNLIVIIGTLLATMFCVYYTFFNEPPVDFRPYAIGSDINEKMKEIEPSETKNIFLYTNTTTGKVERFDINNIPTDTTWTFKDRIDSVIKEGKPAPIHNLRLEDAASGSDVTASLLSEATPAYWVVIYNIDKSNLQYVEETLIPWSANMRKKGTNVYCLLGKSSKELEAKVSANMDIVHADETALKTMIRSNPGIMLVEKGIVKNKWHYRHFDPSK